MLISTKKTNWQSCLKIDANEHLATLIRTLVEHFNIEEKLIGYLKIMTPEDETNHINDHKNLLFTLTTAAHNLEQADDTPMAIASAMESICTCIETWEITHKRKFDDKLTACLNATISRQCPRHTQFLQPHP